MNTPSPASMTHVLTAIEAAATVAFAFSGLLEAARKRLDAVGVCVVAGLAAFGGGTLRDVLLVQWPDALGLGLFTASGTQVAVDAGAPAIVAVLMGVVTAAFGGVLRDIVCNEIPSAFRDHRPYAVCAFAGGWVLVMAHGLGAADWVGLLAAALVAALLRGIALLTGFTLPRWSPGG
jgi:uncharacterized membrane protein YeiH